MDTPRLAIITAALAMLSNQLLGAETKPGFEKDFETARSLAVESGRPLLIHFYADFCPPCRRMEAEVFPDPDLHRQLGELVVSVKVNTALRPDLAQKYGVDRIPHDRVLTPDGKELKRAGGFMSKWSYLNMVRGATRHYALTHPKVVKAKPKPKPIVKKPTQPIVTSIPAKQIVSLDGFCPVELSLNRKWIKGSGEFEVEYKGLKYLVSTQANYTKFQKNPEQYAPQVLGCDPVVLSASQRAIPGKTAFGAFFDGKLYLFESGDSRTTFKSNPLKYIRIQHVLDASKIERTVVR